MAAGAGGGMRWLGGALLLLCLSQLGQAADGGGDRSALQVTDPDVVKASEFALKELQKLCDYCSDELRDAYQSMSIDKLEKAEYKSTTLSPGRMLFLSLDLKTSKPAEGGKAADSQVVIVFENEDKSYNGISMERSPFLEK